MIEAGVLTPEELVPPPRPEPDLAIVTGAVRHHRDHHPQSALPVIEIADSTLAYDREAKGSLYARFGIPEYWIVNLIERVIEVHRHAAPDERARFGSDIATRNAIRLATRSRRRRFPA